MKTPQRHPPRATQRGMATLAITLLLLALMAFMVVFANRSLLLEHRSSANQLRSSIAAEMAEAGLEWAIAMLNQPRPVDANCMPAGSGASFRERYAPLAAGVGLQPVAGMQAACRVGAGGLVCSCPSQPGQNLALGDLDDPTFAIALESVVGDPASLRLTARGCTGQGSPCIPDSARRSDATAQASLVLKARPLLRALPTASVTAGGNASLGTSRIANLEPAAQGQLVAAGGAIDIGSAILDTLPGSPAVNALLPADPALARRLAEDADGSAFFNAFFGMNAEGLRQTPGVRVINGTTAADRAATLAAAYAEGQSVFWIDGELTLGAGELGSVDRPVLIASAQRVSCLAPCTVRGLVYGDVATRDASDLANMEVRGAIVTRGHHVQAGNSSVRYDFATLDTLRRRTALLVRVPGSWHDQ